MNLYNFEEIVDPVIVSRGVVYHENGWVSRLSFSEDGNYRAVVRGTEDYHVFVTVDKDFNIVTTSCNCPFEGGAICKHQTAVYYEMADLLEDPDALHSYTSPDLRTVLDNLSKEQLLETIVELAYKDNVLYDQLIFLHGSKDTQQEPIHFQQLIQSIIQKYTKRNGFISYGEADDFTDELHDVLNKIEITDNPANAMKNINLLFKEAIRYLNFMDDSSGGMDSFLTQAISKIYEAIDSSSDNAIQSDMLEQLLQLVRSSELGDWPEYRLDILDATLPVAHHKQLANILQKELEKMLEEGNGRYQERNIYGLLLEIIKIQGSVNDSTNFLKKHLHFPSFRKQLIEQKMREHLYEEVIQLALEGEKQDVNYRGLITDWKQYRYEACKQAGHQSEQKKLGHELLTRGNFKYYIDLKKFNESNFEQFYRNLKKQLAAENPYIYSQLITTEKDTEAIVAYVENRPQEIESYLEYIIESHEELAIRLFASNIQNSAARSNNRNQYQDVCRTIRRFTKIAGIDAGQAIAEELKITYKRRPAFVDELNKLLITI